jgi:tetratricopeptide (TPR) repeat protein
MALDNLSHCLSYLGHREEALVAIEEAVEIRRSLASDRPAVFNAVLASSLVSLSRRLWDLRRWKEAVAALQQAAEIRRA